MGKKKKSVKKAAMFVRTGIKNVRYECPHCGKLVNYDTTGLPSNSDCHNCLEPIEFHITYINDNEHDDKGEVPIW